jgi:hypothetical protein
MYRGKFISAFQINFFRRKEDWMNMYQVLLALTAYRGTSVVKYYYYYYYYYYLLLVGWD